jgi:putative ATPase
MKQMTLLEDASLEPLASRMRPRELSEFVGQDELVGEGCLLRNMIEADTVSSMILFGPPGVGKTTLANVIANLTKAKFVNFSAVTSGIKEIKEIMAQAEHSRFLGERTVLFVDEIHRFNKAQQDAFLPYVEQGSIILIGATTENPSFQVNSALLSRCKVFLFKALEERDLVSLLERAIKSPRGFGTLEISYDIEALKKIAVFANGDARKTLGTLETVVANLKPTQGKGLIIDVQSVNKALGKKALIYDRNGEEHYNLISALHKSMRNSDPDAAIYYLARMLEAGEDPLYIARRCVRFASEDVGLADSNALLLAVTVWNACHSLGMPECNVHLTQIVTYLSLAPKSNAMEVAYDMAAADVNENFAESVPMHIRNAPTKLMKDLGYSKNYQYAHNTEDKITKMSCLPDSLKDRCYYNPAGMGAEAKLKKRAQAIREWKKGITDVNPFSV